MSVADVHEWQVFVAFSVKVFGLRGAKMNILVSPSFLSRKLLLAQCLSAVLPRFQENYQNHENF